MPKQIALSDHARTALNERGLDLLERRFCAVPERGGRILRVVCGEDDATITVVTAFIDRRARRPT